MNILGRGKPKERREEARAPTSAFKAFYWTGGVCQPLRVRDINETGAYLEMASEWVVGTAVHLVLECDGPTPSSPKEVFTLWARIVRADSGGMGVQFIDIEWETHERFQRALTAMGKRPQERRAEGQSSMEFTGGLTLLSLLIASVMSLGAALYGGITAPPAARTGAGFNASGRTGGTAPWRRGSSLVEFALVLPLLLISTGGRYLMGEEKKGPFQLSSQHSLPGNRVKPQSFRGRGSSGNSLLEFALVLPLLFVLIINAVNFGGMLYAWICVSNAARTGADYMVRGGATVGSPGLPTGAAVSSVVTGDLQALPNKAPGAVVVCVCTDNNGTTSRYPPGCAGVPEADPEPTYFVSGSVDVTYTYVPFIPLWSFPKLGISATLPPTTIHRQASARLLQ